MSVRGVGDRWLAGEAVPGVAYALHQRVEVVGGAADGRRGAIALLVGLSPEPAYLVTLAGRGEARVRQSMLRPVEAA